MRQVILGLIGVAFAALAGCGQPGEKAAGGADAPVAAPANAEATIVAWARGLHGTNLIEPVAIFYGDFSGDGAVDALAWANYAMGGSGAGRTVGLFRNEGGGMVFVREDDTAYGSDPRDVAFSPGFIRLTTTMPKEGDPHCCPTGSQEWVIETE